MEEQVATAGVCDENGGWSDEESQFDLFLTLDKLRRSSLIREYGRLEKTNMDSRLGGKMATMVGFVLLYHRGKQTQIDAA